jgi:uncharacterized protein (DUF2141 family)
MHKLRVGHPQRFLWVLCALFLTVGCAKQGRPTGGPVDRTAPTVTGHLPAADATEISLTQEITIDFSEAMDRRRVEEAVFIAPNGDLGMSWKGRQLRIRMSGGLTDGRTYVVTIGADARDLRGNRLKDSYSFAFSTGESLDSGQLQGRIIDADNAVQGSAYVWAYDLQTFDGRTALDDPAFVTQTGADGSYRFERLAHGRYRVVGFVDGNRNQKPDAGEALSLPAEDVQVAGQGVTLAGDQRLAQRDILPRVVQASVVSSRRILLLFDQPIDSSDLHVQLEPLVIESIHADPLDGKRLHIQTSLQEEGRTYRLHVQLAGEAVGVSEESLRGTERQDTKAPAVSRSTPSGSVAMATGTQMFFSEAMDTTRVPSGWTGADSTSSPVGNWAWVDWTHLSFAADTSFVLGPQAMELDLRALRDRAGNAMADSTLRITFDVLDSADLATITGQCAWPGEISGQAHIQLWDKTDTKPVAAAISKVDTPRGSSFRFGSLVPGQYVLTAWLDRDGDGTWDAGQLEPYGAAEPFMLYGTVEVEAGDILSLTLPRIEAEDP